MVNRIGYSFRIMFVVLSICVINSIVCACSSAPAGNPKVTSGAEGRHTSVQEGKWSFIPPEIPVALVTIEAKTEYLIKHFWENYDFTDTVAISKPEYAEQILVNYLSMLTAADEVTARNCLGQLAEDMRKDSVVYAWFDEKLEHYLYDPNSPMRNEEYYIAVLEGMLNSGKYQLVEKIRPEFRMHMLLKNRKGNRAENFSFMLKGGKKASLYDLKSTFTLLLLYDPECENCRHAIDEMVHSSVIQDLTTITHTVREAPMKVLTVCVEHDTDSWQQHLSMLPEHWLNGFDEKHQIRDKELYDLRSFPSLYLLDRDKRVILKDVDVQDVIDYFTKQS